MILMLQIRKKIGCRMANIKVTGIVLNENNYGDFDKILTLLTPNIGKITCIAKGARRLKSTLLAGSQLFAFGEFMLYKSSNTYMVNSIEIIELFYNIRVDLDKLKYAVHLNKIVSDVTDENQHSYHILQLILNTLYLISEEELNYELLVNTFKFRMLKILGFTPEINRCVGCGGIENVNKFSVNQNGFKCGNCGKLDSSCLIMGESTRDAIRYIFYAHPKKIHSFELKNDQLLEFNLISKVYFDEKLEKDYKIANLF